jgi:hypothetical protein
MTGDVREEVEHHETTFSTKEYEIIVVVRGVPSDLAKDTNVTLCINT